MSTSTEYYNSKEEYILSENKEEVIKRRFSGDEELCYQILFLQVYSPTSLQEQEELFKKLNNRNMNSSVKEMKDTLYSRYMLLKQGADPSLLEDVSEHLITECGLSFSFGTAPKAIQKEVTEGESGNNQLNYDSLSAFIADQSKRMKCTTAQYEHLLNTNDDASISKNLLENVTRPGLPGVVKNILMYVSTLEKKHVADQTMFLSLLTYEDMEILQKKMWKKFGFDLFSNGSFSNKYMERFGDVTIEDESDPTSLQLVERIRQRRIEFIRKQKLMFLCGELGELVRVQMKQDHYDKKLFLEYLEKVAINCDETLTKRSKVKSYGLSLSDLMSKFLHHIFPQEKPDEFMYYINPDIVLRIYEEECLLAGESIKPSLMTINQQEILQKEKRCRVLDENCLFYRTGDIVSIKVELKNIDILQIHVFELNTLTYYQKKDSDIPASIDLDGLQPLYTNTQSYIQSSIIAHTETFQFPHINHRGVFVVDFIAGTMNSRFVVRMGYLKVLSRQSLAGYAVTVVDEFGKRVDKDVKAILDTREYQLNSNNEILIPFLPPSESEKTATLLICQEVQPDWFFTIRHSMTLQKESFNLAIHGDVDNEAIVRGNDHCRLVLRIVAHLNQLNYPLSLLRNVSIVIICEAAQDVRNETTLKPTLKDDEEFTYVFRVLDSIKSLQVNMTADVALVNGSLKHIQASSVLYTNNEVMTHSVEPSSITAINTITTLFRHTNLHNQIEYIAQVYGNSGEAIVDSSVTVKVQSVFCLETHSQELVTDSKGQLNLGSLNDISAVSVNEVIFGMVTDSFDVRTSWCVSEEESVQALIPLVTTEQTKYNLICLKSTYEYQSLTNNLIFSSEYVQVTGLKAGEYCLFVTGDDQKAYAISISIRRTSILSTNYDNYIVFDRWARRLIDAPLSLTCSLEANRKLKVNLQGGSETRRVHVLCKHFFDSKMVGDNLSAGDNPIDVTIVSLNPDSSSIVNDRSLPEEYAYIMDRKRQKRDMPGNMLPHPGPLLNPSEYSETKNTVQKAKKGRMFGSAQECQSPNYSPTSPGYSCSADHLSMRSENKQREAVEAIIRPSELILDVQLNEDGEGVLDLAGASKTGVELTVIGVDEGCTVQKQIYVPETTPEEAAMKGVSTMLHSLHLKHSLDITKHYTEKKMITLVKKGDSLHLNSKNNMQILSSLSDIFLLLKTLTQNPELSQFSFLLSWTTLSEEEKLQQYNRVNCSELNVFLYFRDRLFFDQCILPYLVCKIEKSFIDLFLTGADVTSFIQPGLFDRLNAFEKALLCSQLPKEYSLSLIDGMSVCGNGKKMNAKEFSRIFNTALKMKSMDEPEPEVEEGGVMDEEVEEHSVMEPVMMDACMARFSNNSLAPNNHSMVYKPSPESVDSYMPSSPMYMGSAPMMRCMGAPPSFKSRSMISAMSLRGGGEVDRQAMMEMKKAEKHYEKMENTKEYIESYYFNSKAMYSSTSLVPNSPFWTEFTRYMSGDHSQPFLSSDFIYCTHSLSEVLFCLAVLGINLKEMPYQFNEVENEIILDSSEPVFIFHKMLQESSIPTTPGSLIVLQKYLDNNNMYIKVQNEKLERYMKTNEFLPQQPYTCKVILSNTDALPMNVTLLYQIPEGSFPMSNTFTLHTESITVKPYSTATFSYCFYFSAEGDYKHYPVHIIDEMTSEIVAFASSPFQPLHVIPTLQTVDQTSWRDVAYYSSDEELLRYLQSQILDDIDWSLMMWRLRNEGFYKRFISLLGGLGYFNEELWKFGIYHMDAKITGQFLSKKFTKKCGLVFESPILTVDPVIEDLYQIREYKPLITSRSFRLGSQLQITNDKLEKQYEKFLTLLSEKKPVVNDYLVMCYYLILMDRVKDALILFQNKVCEKRNDEWIRHPECTCGIQFDYMQAYFDCFTPELMVARRLSEQYKEYPVMYWRSMFANIAELVRDADGTLDQMDDNGDVKDMTNLVSNVIQSKRVNAQRDSSLELSLKERQLTVNYSKLTRIQVNLYELNVELMFSNSPFMRDSSSDSLFIRSNYSETLTLPAIADNQIYSSFTYSLPEAYAQKNLLVEVCSGALRETCYAFNSTLSVVLSAKSGQLRVFDQNSKRSVANCYVKVYAKLRDSSVFLKDGFTDIRGSFDYFSVSNDIGDKTVKLAIFVDKEGMGSCIREVLPPSTVSKM